ncbi:hypothetical protein BGZ60DRAFT_496463 [Tricladium varicosporioides]|nr:hypothetical protein BGZ60DRAFT_496463 [Hymenoscyphus varicosporioides]
MHSLLPLVVALLPAVNGINFPFERTQLSPSDADENPSLQFGNTNSQSPRANTTSCRNFPGDASWPSDSTWAGFNNSLSGALLKPTPLAASCYPGLSYDSAKCSFLLNNVTGTTRIYNDDPITELSQWTQGGTCMLPASGNCTMGGYPIYVVNVTNVRQIQGAVNFARNRNIRVVIKSTGHDFGGRSVGAGALSIWTHYLKDFEFLPEYSQGNYTGKAVRFGSGLEAWELYNYMEDNNITVVAPGWTAVGMGGGWILNGGHGYLTSMYGVGSDSVLSMQVVTADGRFVTADSETNEDLFWAMRGGGGATFGVVTSIVMKAFPPINVTTSPLAFATSNVDSVETFWKGISIYYRFAKKVNDAGGIGFSYIYPLGNNTFSFTTTSTLPGMSPSQVNTLLKPLYTDLNRIGINVTNPVNPSNTLYGSRRPAIGDRPGNARYRSRLIPAKNWADDALWNKTIAAIRSATEAGYTFHGTLHSPTLEVAGSGRDSAVNPSWRRAVMHSMLLGNQPVGLTAQEATDADTRIQTYMNKWRELTPGEGSYMNEGDPGEPNWQRSFFGDHYPRLLEIKKAVDPWELFWAQTSVGSEGWAVKVVDGYPNTQNGRLCRVSA